VKEVEGTLDVYVATPSARRRQIFLGFVFTLVHDVAIG